MTRNVQPLAPHRRARRTDQPHSALGVHPSRRPLPNVAIHSLVVGLILCGSIACSTTRPAFSTRCNPYERNNRVYAPLNNELLVALGQNMLKIRDRGGPDNRMFFGNWRLGRQRFQREITAVAFVEGHTLIGFEDGRLLKVRGTGGTGENMFAIHRTDNGFRTVEGYDYYVGSHQFNSGVMGIYPADAYTFISFRNGKLLKVRGSGGSGANLFAIHETRFNFSGLSGYNYYVGDQRFRSAVVDVSHGQGVTLISLRDGRILKVRGFGGSGHNMFAVDENRNHFTGISGYDYYQGDQKFEQCASAVSILGDETLIGFWDGRILKVRGTGGTGRRMFNVREASYGFENHSESSAGYLIGSQHLSRKITTIQQAGDELLVALQRRGTLKISGTGGTGGNMFNIEWSGGEYRQASSNYPQYLLGQDRQRGYIRGITPVAGFTFFVNRYSEVLKVSGTGGEGTQMLGAQELWCDATFSAVVGCYCGEDLCAF